jgi:AAA domain
MRFRQSQLCLIAGQPNSGKSLMALVYALKTGVPTLYFSADTDPITQMFRTVAGLTGISQQQVETYLDADSHYFDPLLAEKGSHIKWVFDPSPDMDSIELEILAYGEVYGMAPALIVIDNLMNCVSVTGEEWSGIRAIMSELHHVARKTGACVLALTHMSEAGTGSPTLPAPRRAILGKASQLPSMILSIAMDPEYGQFRVAAVKNRFGEHSADATNYVSLLIDPARVQIADPDLQGRADVRPGVNHIGLQAISG